ncbi:MAG TPA: type II toxin-antitoxin system VapC family toxin [Chloroflexota bacterium]|nr:type II toxin-antitoxin system VapC family toxin [Chloroflexota bacterium]
MNDGLLDTNVFLHAHTTDAHSAECRRFLAAVSRGELLAILESVVAHELTSVLPRLIKQMTRRDVAGYLLQVLSWEGIRGDKDILADGVGLWRDVPNLAFVDAYLLARAIREGRPIYSKNLRDVGGHGAVVPNPLPA